MTMTSKAKTEGVLARCPLCLAETGSVYSERGEVAACPKCGAGLVQSSMLLARLQALARKHPALELEEITANSPWPLGGDSLTSVEVMLELERELGVSISPREAERIMTVGQAIRFFTEHAGRKREGAES
jgi:acyl carrier protein